MNQEEITRQHETVRGIVTEPHGTIVAGRLKGVRAAKVKDEGPGFILIRVFDCPDPSFGPDRPIRCKTEDWKQD